MYAIFYSQKIPHTHGAEIRGGAGRQIRGVPTSPFWVSVRVYPYKNRPTVYHSIPFSTIQYRSIPFSVIENVNGKCIGLNGNLNGKT